MDNETNNQIPPGPQQPIQQSMPLQPQTEVQPQPQDFLIQSGPELQQPQLQQDTTQSPLQATVQTGQPTISSAQTVPLSTNGEQLTNISKSFSKILVYGRVISAVNIFQIIYFGISLISVIPSLYLISFLPGCLLGSDQEAVNEVCYIMGPSIIFLIPSLILRIIEIVLLCYVAVLGFSLKRYANDYKNLKKHLIIFAVISTITPFGVFALIGDIIVFASLLPKYKQELSNHTTSITNPQPNSR